MADGFTRSLKPLVADGVYLDLPMQDYIDDPAISGSGLKKLLTSPADFKWELPGRNPLYTPPESDAKALGTLVHCAVLEGMDAFEHRYFVAPELDDNDPRVIRTADHAKAWLKDHDQKVSYKTKAEAFDAVRGHWDMLKLTDNRADDEGPIFLDDLLTKLTAEGNGRREAIKRKSFEYVAQVAQVVRSWPDAQSLLGDGLAEVSIFWTEGSVRYKARLDWLTATAILDLKKFGLPPRRGLSLRSHLQREIVSYSYDIQAVHNTRAALQIPRLMQSELTASASGEGARERLAKLERIATSIMEQAPTFHWLFLRTPGPPQGMIMSFRSDTRRWAHAEGDIEEAIRQLGEYRERCGDELNPEKQWIEVGVVEWDDEDLPEYAWEIAR